MEFNTWNTDMFNFSTPTPVIMNCYHEFETGITLALNVMSCLFILNRMFGWWSDPLGIKLQQRIDELQQENDVLIDQVTELKEDANELSTQLTRANNSLNALRDVLNIHRPIENDDTQG